MRQRLGRVRIDPEAIKKVLESTGYTKLEISRDMGHSDTFMHTVMTRENMSKADLLLFCTLLGVSEDTIIYHEPPKPEPISQEQAAKGYNVAITMEPGKVLATLEFNGAPIYQARFRLKGDSELSLIQSISYAAHLIYKMAEQDALAREA